MVYMINILESIRKNPIEKPKWESQIYHWKKLIWKKSVYGWQVMIYFISNLYFREQKYFQTILETFIV